jgi:ribosomal protein S18 acetylase RimI-like enzyme
MLEVKPSRMTTAFSSYTIQRGFLPTLNVQAATLYAQAFRKKFKPFLGDKTVTLLSESLHPDFAFTAMRDEELLGLAGFQTTDKKFVQLDRDTFCCIFGLLSGSIRYVLAEWFFARPHEVGTLLMDGIVVKREARGQGVGTKLLESIFTYAQAQGFERIRLDVIDTNPRARKLYEELGFAATQTAHLPFLKPWFEFSSVMTMVKVLE